MSRAVELMVSHVDNLKRRNERDTELDETKKLNRKILRRNYSDPRGKYHQCNCLGSNSDVSHATRLC